MNQHESFPFCCHHPHTIFNFYLFYFRAQQVGTLPISTLAQLSHTYSHREINLSDKGGFPSTISIYVWYTIYKRKIQQKLFFGTMILFLISKFSPTLSAANKKLEIMVTDLFESRKKLPIIFIVHKKFNIFE
jgi:hypothetical protein